jgi:hypothetical protein
MKDFNEPLISGNMLINVSATGITLETIFKMLSTIKKDLSHLNSCINNHFSFREVRTFAIHVGQMVFVDFILYEAFIADVDSVFWQD